MLVDPDGPGGASLMLTESGAILIYLAEKTGLLLPTRGVARAGVRADILPPNWHWSNVRAGLYFQKQAPEQVPLALTRFNTQLARVMAAFDTVLEEHPFAAGFDFTIADVALDNYPNVKAW